jgi:hypothetical protein
VKDYERKDKMREEKIKRIRERKLDKIRSKERKILREWEDYLPGPGEYEINYEAINDKSPSVINYFYLVYYCREIRQIGTEHDIR